ncbi:ABC-2 type transporter, partial [Helicosporidium sp. ATCC 50920]
LLMGIFVGAIFFQVGADISGAQNRAGGLFFALAFFAFTSLSTVDLFVAERKMVAREVRGGYYSPASYLLAKAVLDGLLLRAVPALLYAAPFYPMMGLASGGAQVGLFLATLTAFALAVGALSLLVSAASASAGRASLVMNVVLLLSLLVGGFFVNVASIPGWIRWLHYLSLFYYAYSALMINELSDLLLNFVLQGYAAVSGVRGTTFLAIIGVQPDTLWRSVVVLDCLWAALLALAVLALYLGIPRARARAALRAEDVA